MDTEKAKRLTENMKTYDAELIYPWVMYLLSIDQISIENLFFYELSPVPVLLFSDSEEGYYQKNKSTLRS